MMVSPAVLFFFAATAIASRHTKQAADSAALRSANAAMLALLDNHYCRSANAGSVPGTYKL